MRVTKLIREYVVKRVRENFPKTPEELAWDELKDHLSRAREKANDIINKYAEKIAKEMNAEFGLPDDYNLSICENRSYVTSCWCSNAEAYQKASDACDARDKKIKETIEEILVNLELGGSKAELEEMLANIGK